MTPQDPVRDFIKLANAEEHIIGQNMLLDHIAKQHPDLIPQVERAKADLHSESLRPALQNIPKLLAHALPNAPAEIRDWHLKRPERIANAARILASSQITREKALESLLAISRRGTGEFELAEVAEAIVSANPRFRNNPIAEIDARHWKVLSSHNHAKGKGRNVTVFVPKTWQVAEGNGPNLVMKAISNQGHGPVMVMLQVHNQELDEEGAPRLLTAAQYDEILKGADQIPVALNATKLFARPEHRGNRWWIRQAYMMPIQNGTKETVMRIENFLIYHNRHVVSVFFAITAENNGTAESLAQHYESSMRQIVDWTQISDEATYPQFADKGFSLRDPEMGNKIGIALALYVFLAPLSSSFWSIFAPFAGTLKGAGAIYTVIQMGLVGGFPFTLWRYFQINGRPGWLALVPVLSAVELCRLAGLRKRWLLLILIPYLGSWVVHGLISRRLSLRHGSGWWITTTTILFPATGLLLLSRRKPATDKMATAPDSGDTIYKAKKFPLEQHEKSS